MILVSECIIDVIWGHMSQDSQGSRIPNIRVLVMQCQQECTESGRTNLCQALSTLTPDQV